MQTNDSGYTQTARQNCRMGNGATQIGDKSSYFVFFEFDCIRWCQIMGNDYFVIKLARRLISQITLIVHQFTQHTIHDLPHIYRLTGQIRIIDIFKHGGQFLGMSI